MKANTIKLVSGLALTVLFLFVLNTLNVDQIVAKNTTLTVQDEKEGDKAEESSEGASGVDLFFDKFTKSFKPASDGSSFMWIIGLMGVFSLAISMERLYFIYVRSNVDAPKFMAEIRKLVAGGNLKKAVALCETAKDKALPFVVLAGLKRALENEGGPIDFRAIQNAVDEGTLEIIPKLSERAGYLAMIGNVATLLGLMGTIYGLIVSFASVGSPSVPADKKSQLLADGISAAMGTTMFGLVVAIPSIVFYTFITTKTSKIIDDMDEHMVKLINLITGNR